MSKNHAEVYFHLNHMVQVTYMENLFSQVNIKPSFKCLDIGCGTGNTTAAVTKKVGDSGLVIGCDPDKSRIMIAQKNHSYKNISFLERTLPEITLHDYKFDLAFNNVVYHWLLPEDQMKITEKAFSLLKSGCFFLLTITREYKQNVELVISFLSEDTQKRINGALRFQPEAYYKDLFTKAGFEIISFSNISPKIAVLSIKVYLEWKGATLNAMEELKKAYAVNKEKI